MREVVGELEGAVLYLIASQLGKTGDLDSNLASVNVSAHDTAILRLAKDMEGITYLSKLVK